MDFGVILLDIIMLLILTFGLGMLVGHTLTKKKYDNEKNCEDNHWEEYEFFKDEE